MPPPEGPYARRIVEAAIPELAGTPAPGRRALVLLGAPGNGVRSLALHVAPSLDADAAVVHGVWHPTATVQVCATAVDLPRRPPAASSPLRWLVVGCYDVDGLPAWVTDGTAMAAETITVGPLSLAELHDFLEARLGRQVDLATARELGTAAGFAPGALSWLVDAARRSGCLEFIDDAWQLTGDLVASVVVPHLRTVLATSDPSHVRVVHRLALAEPLSAARLTPAELEVAGRLRDTGIVNRHADDTIAFRSPAIAEALRRLSPAEQIERQHRASLEAGSSDPVPVSWALERPEPVPDELVDAAIATATERHDWRAALRLADLAVDRLSDGRSGRRCGLLLRAAYAARFLPDADDALAYLDAAESELACFADASADAEKEMSTQIAIARAELLHYHQGDLKGALAALTPTAGSDRRRWGLLAAHRILHLAYGGRSAEALREAAARGVLRHAPRGARQRVRIAEAIALVAQGRPRRALRTTMRVAARDVLLPGGEPWVNEELRAAYLVAALASDGPAAYPALIRHLEDSRDGAYRPDLVTFHLARAAWELANGDVPAAHGFGGLALATSEYTDPSGMRPALVALVAETSALLGEATRAEELLGVFPRLPARSSAAIAGGSQAHLAIAGLALGHPHAGTALLETARGFSAQQQFGFAAEVLYSGVRFSRRRAARALVELGDELDGALHQLRVDHANAVLADSAVDMLAVAERLEKAGLRLFAAEAAATAARMPHAPDALRRRAVAQASSAARELGLRRHPLLPSASHAPDGSNLTPREQEVSELIAAGLSNEEIAARLGLSRRTVEGHIARLYRKTGERRRTPARRGPRGP